MRLSLALAFLSLSSVSSAAYFSEGWRPGQPIPTRGVRHPGSTSSIPIREDRPELPSEPQKPFFDRLQDTILSPFTTGPLGAMLAKAGFNVTSAIERARPEVTPSRWHPDIPIVHDENIEELMEYESLTPGEEELRTWVLEITPPDGNAIALFADEQFDKAYNLTMDAGNDLPHVRWGRVNYVNVTMITTKWIIWRVPVIVIARHRGKELRFFRAGQLNLRELHAFLQKEAWRSVEPWKSDWSPTGKRAWILHQLGLVLEKYYALLGTAPRWVIMIITGMFGSTVISLLHGSGKGKKKTVVVSPVKATTGPAESAKTAATKPAEVPKKSTSGKAKKRAAR